MQKLLQNLKKTHLKVLNNSSNGINFLDLIFS